MNLFRKTKVVGGGGEEYTGEGCGWEKMAVGGKVPRRKGGSDGGWC